MGDRNLVYPYLATLTKKEAEQIFTHGKGIEDLPSPKEPVFVLLFGSPGSGKSTALARLPELIGLQPAEAVQISLDSLVESLEPFRSKTFAIAQKMLEEKGKNLNSASLENIGEIAGKASGPYISYMRSKKNNRPGHEKNTLEESLNEIRFALLEKALQKGKNIIYERTVSDDKKNTLQDEVFKKITDSGIPYKVFVIYTKIDDESALQERLRMRPLAMMKRNPPFFRGVPPFMAGKFMRTHEEYFRKYLLPLADSGKQLIVVYWDGRKDLFIPEQAAAGAAAAPNALPAPPPAPAPAAAVLFEGNGLGGKRKATQKRKSSKKRKTRSRRS